MKEFSKRYGYQLEKPIQIESMDEDLRNRLWNCLIVHFWSARKPVYNPSAQARLRGRSQKGPVMDVIKSLWTVHLNLPVDEMPQKWPEPRNHLKKSFFSSEWYEAYDFLEFMAPYADHLASKGTERFTKSCNQVLETERSAYRFVGTFVAPISHEVEAQQVEEMLKSPNYLVRVQIESAVKKLSEKPKPDLRNCIKESICAVESAARTALGVKGGTLGKLIPKLRDNLGMHTAIVGSLDKVYGWTCDIARHGVKEDDNLTIDDARFGLVTCSAFANYLLRASERTGILKPGTP